jgi:predicted RNA-binding protein with PUA-like domain
MKYWLAKSEPTKYSWADFVRDGSTYWDGVRNYQARNNLAEMKVGDQVLFYHSVVGKEVVGIARVRGESYPDPTIDDDRWVVVDLEPLKPLSRPVTLDAIKKTPALAEIALVRQSRLSVVPLAAKEFKVIVKMGS